MGRVQFSVDIDGIEYFLHEINNGNNLDIVYMKSPTLPVRYEVHNVGAAANPVTLEQICCAVYSDGGYEIPGLEFSAGHGPNRRAITTTRTPILAIRLKNEWPVGQPNRKTIKFIDAAGSAITNNAYLEIAHVHNPTAFSGTWAPVDDSSAVEYSTDVTVATGTHEHVIQPFYIMAGQAGKGGTNSVSGEYINIHSYASQNFDSTNSAMFVIFATSESGTSNVTAHITFVEMI